MTAFLLRRLAYLAVLVVVATVVAYFLAATQLNPRSRYEGRNPPPPPAAVDAILDELNLNDKNNAAMMESATAVLPKLAA